MIGCLLIMKLAVIGLDGAAFELLDPWIQEGSLPNLKKLKEEGIWADMESVLPPVTSPNWKAYSTGKNPGKLGIFWWENIDFKEEKVYYPADRKFKHDEIWDHLDSIGLKIGVMGMPTTYPPQPINGFFVSCGPDAEETGFTYPKELEDTLVNKYGIKPQLETMIKSNPEKATEEIYKIIEGQFDAALHYGEEFDVDFLQLSIFHINVLQHFFWDDEKTKKGWKMIDKKIGEVYKKADNILFMSDHGCNKIEHVFNINTWLENKGYLKTTFGMSDFLNMINLDREKLGRLTRFLHLNKVLKKILPASMKESVPTKSGEVKKEGKSSKVDWKNTKVFASGQGPIYINEDAVEDVEKLKKQLIHELENVEEPKTGKKLIRKVYRKEEIYEGEFLDEAPDLVIDQEKGVHIPGGLGRKNVFGFSEKWEAENKKHGLFGAIGEDIANKEKITDVSILDLAPTILHIHDVPIPRDMDGKVLKQIFKEDSDPGKREVKISTKQKEKEKLDQALSNLKADKNI